MQALINYHYIAEVVFRIEKHSTKTCFTFLVNYILSFVV